MAADRNAFFAIPAAAVLLLWPALWNGYPIVFADTGTYLSQAIHLYAGWDRPVFYSLFMLPLHGTVTLWPVVAAQALMTAWLLRLVCRVLVPGFSRSAFVASIGVLSVCTWLPWMVSELMPDVFTPLLVLVLCLLACVPERLSRRERVVLAGLATFLIASQQSSVPLACVLLGALAVLPRGTTPYCPRHGRSCAGHPRTDCPCEDGRDKPGHDGEGKIWPLLVLPPALALLALCTVNLAAHGRFAPSPFGNVFLLARVIYDGPGMTTLRRDCPHAHWRLCPFLDSFPPTSDDFLWTPDSPMAQAGGAKAVSEDASAIISATLRADPIGEATIALTNTLEQMTRFDSGDGLNPWPDQVSPWIERDFPAREHAAYVSARQQTATLSVPPALARIHAIVAIAGVIACVILLPIAITRRMACAGFLVAALLTLPVSAAITGGLSGPHDRYQSRIMWLPAFIAAVSLTSFLPGIVAPLPNDRIATAWRRRGTDPHAVAKCQFSPD